MRPGPLVPAGVVACNRRVVRVTEQPDTPFGSNVRYTVRLHVVGEERREDGSVRGADRDVEIRVVSPLGQARAVALAVLHFVKAEPRSLFREVDVVKIEHHFAAAATDVRDSESYAR